MFNSSIRMASTTCSNSPVINTNIPCSVPTQVESEKVGSFRCQLNDLQNGLIIDEDDHRECQMSTALEKEYE
jgi:hypothetical protein